MQACVTALPVSRSGARRLLVVIPALDEEQTIAQVIRDLPTDLPGIGAVEVLVVDDGSRDATGLRASALGATVVRHPQPLGVGSALHTALDEAVRRGVDLLVSIDADGQFDPRSIAAVVAPVVAGEADFVTATRFARPDLVPRMPWLRLAGNRLLAHILSRLTQQRFTDVACGLRCYGQEAILRLHLQGRFTYTQEVLLNLAFKRLRIAEVPVAVRGERPHGRGRVSGRPWRYALRCSLIILRCYRDYRPLPMLGGLAAAIALLALLIGGGVGLHYLHTGAFTPYKAVAFAAVALLGLSLLVLQTGVIGDMLNRHRAYLEELLYRDRARCMREGGWGQGGGDRA